MDKCKCTFAQRMIGDGCEVCNPTRALEIERERIAELDAALTEVCEERDKYDEDYTRLRKLAAAHEKYIKLLGEDLAEFAGFASVHGLTSSRVEEGKVCRADIAFLKRSE